MPRLRTSKSEERYKQHIANGGLENGCRLCEAPALKAFEYWKVVKNEFPYDRIAKVHDMIVPKRHAVESELQADELTEFAQIKKEYLGERYEYSIEAMHKLKSIPSHFHLHLIVAKEE